MKKEAVMKKRSLRRDKKEVAQKGSAMVLALVLLVASTVMTLGGLLAVSRNQRIEQRALDRIEHYWFAESIFEMSTAVLNDYIKTNIKHPDYLGDYTLCAGAVAENACDNNYHAFLKGAFKKTHSTIKESIDPGNPTENELVSFDLKLTDWPGKPSTDPQPTDAWRTYTATVKLKNKHSLEQVKFSHSFKIGTYSIYDYGVFYNQDLEMAFGPSATVQGPIFSNGDIYLMTNFDETLTLEQTDPSKRILESAGNTYFYFKRAWGYNYMRDTNFQGKVPSNLKPDPFVDYDFYHSVHPTTWSSYNRTANSVHNNEPMYYYDQVERLIHETGTYAAFPFYYFYRNNARRSLLNNPSQSEGAPPKICFKNKNGNSTCIDLPEQTMTATYKHYPFPAIQETTIWTEYSDYEDNRLQVSLSTNYDVHGPAKNATETATMKAPVSPEWPNYAKNHLGGLVLDDSNLKKDLPLPDKLKDYPRLLIEPIQSENDPLWSGDTPKYRGLTDVEKQKVLPRFLINQADLIIDCTGVECVGSSSDQINYSGLTINVDSNFIDKRLTGSTTGKVKAAVLDFSGFTYSAKAVNIEDPTPEDPTHQKQVFPDDGLVIYVKVCAANSANGYCNDQIRVVKITGASKALVSGKIVLRDGTESSQDMGYTIATNGRLWVEGNFNIKDKNGTTYPTSVDGRLSANVVSAALMSDSFGVLFPDPAGENRMTLNAAVITGTLNSSLQQKDCSDIESFTAGGQTFDHPKNTASGADRCLYRDKDGYIDWNLGEFIQDGTYLTLTVKNPLDPSQGETPPMSNGTTNNWGWPVVAHYEPTIGGISQLVYVSPDYGPPSAPTYTAAQTAKLIPALSLPGLDTFVLTGNAVYPYANMNWICGLGQKVNYQQKIISGEDPSSSPVWYALDTCWNGDASDASKFYNNPLRSVTVTGLHSVAQCYVGKENQTFCDESNDPSKQYYKDVNGIARFETVWPITNNSGSMEKVKFTYSRIQAIDKSGDPTNNIVETGGVKNIQVATNLFHASLNDYAIAQVPLGKPTTGNSYKLYYDDANDRIVACLDDEAYTLTPLYGDSSRGLNLAGLGAGSCAGLTPYIAVKSRIDNWGRSTADTSSYPIYNLGFFRGESAYSGRHYYALGKSGYILRSEDRHNVDNIDRPVQYWSTFFWKGNDGEFHREEGASVCGKAIALSTSGDPHNILPLPGNICVNDYNGNRKLNFCFARPLNKLFVDAWPAYLHNYYWPLYIPRYSGGLENLINLQQSLENDTLVVQGSFSSMWESEELKRPNGMLAYYQSDIYDAPKRLWYYNPNLKNNPPPGSPSLYGLERGSVKEEALD